MNSKCVNAIILHSFVYLSVLFERGNHVLCFGESKTTWSTGSVGSGWQDNEGEEIGKRIKRKEKKGIVKRKKERREVERWQGPREKWDGHISQLTASVWSDRRAKSLKDFLFLRGSIPPSTQVQTPPAQCSIQGQHRTSFLPKCRFPKHGWSTAGQEKRRTAEHGSETEWPQNGNGKSSDFDRDKWKRLNLNVALCVDCSRLTLEQGEKRPTVFPLLCYH